MSGTVSFSPMRLWRLMYGDLVTGGRGVGVIAGAVAAVAVAFAAVWPFPLSEATYSSFLLPFILFVGVVRFAARGFAVLHTSAGGIECLTAPASLLEKFVSRLLQSGLVYALGGVAFSVVVSIVVIGVRSALGREAPGIFNPFTRDIGVMLADFLVIQAVVLYGSICFRRHALFKTVLVGAVFAFLVMMYANVMTRLLLGEAGAPGLPEGGADRMVQWREWWEALSTVFRYSWYAAAPLFWAVGYMRITEIEV